MRQDAWNGTILLIPILRNSHQFGSRRTIIPATKRQIGKNLPGFANGNSGENQWISHVGFGIPIAGKAMVIESSLHFFILLLIIFTSQVFKNGFSIVRRIFQHFLTIGFYFLPIKVVRIGIFTARI
ncbi:unknown [Prevotella sp. CAG:891]|nr:unknown [Prevotella sp. CAG:891]